MEKQTGTFPEERIRHWRERLSERPGIRVEDAEELEHHLRDTMQSLERGGLDGAEAFLVASRRVGPPVDLGEEYSKARPMEVWRSRVLWMITGILGFWVLTGMGKVLAFGMVGLLGPWVSSGLLLGYGALGLQAVGWVVAAQWVMTWTRRNGLALGNERVAGGMGGWLLFLFGLGVVVRMGEAVLGAWAATRNTPTILSQFYLVQMWAAHGLALVLAGGMGWWLARGKRLQGVRSGWLAVLLAMVQLLNVGCKPATRPQAEGKATQAANAGTPFEHCLALVESDLNAAVTAFLKIDVTTAPLFTPGSPLAYSEAQFIKLPRSVSEQIHPQILADLSRIKQLITEVKARRLRARQESNSVLVEGHTRSLKTLGARLEGADQLQVTRLVGRSITRIAAE
jgi:hypothetical protein